MIRIRRTATVAILMSVFASGTAQAGGFALIEQGASGMGNAYAGASAVSADASTVWFNPAGMLSLVDPQFALAGHVIAAESNFSDRGTSLNAAFDSEPVTGDATENSSGTTPIPNIYYTRRLRDDLAIGFGISVPFGSSTDYARDWVGRYQATESSISAIDINPSFAYRVSPGFTIGGGVSLQRLAVTLGNAVDSGAACVGLALRGAVDLAQCDGAGLTTAGVLEQDGYAETSGDSLALTFNAGMIVTPSVDTRIGLAYRHGVKHDLEGTSDFTTNSALQAVLDANAFPIFQNVDVTAKAHLPASLMMSVSHEANDKVQLLADATWTGWSTIEELRIKFDNPAQPDSFNTLNYEDTWRYSFGVNYHQSDKLTLRGGVAYDQDPVPDARTRTARSPGSDRRWIALGLGYKATDLIMLDVGFAHVLLDETPIDNASEAAGGTTLRGVFDNSANLLSAQLTWQFQ